MRGAPQLGFSATILEMSSRNSLPVLRQNTDLPSNQVHKPDVQIWSFTCKLDSSSKRRVDDEAQDFPRPDRDENKNIDQRERPRASAGEA
jgi:hypothetical protein